MSSLVSGSTHAMLAALCWSVGVILFKRSGDAIHPVGLNLLKNLFTLPLFVVTWLLTGSLAAINHDHYLLLLGSGVVGIGLADTLFFYSLNLLGAARSAILDCTYSPFIIGMSYLYLDERLSLQHGAGAALVVGAVFLISRGRAGDSRSTTSLERRDLVVGMVSGLTAMASMGAAVVAIKPILQYHDVLFAMIVRMTGGIAALLVWSFISPVRSRAFAALKPQASWRHALSGTFFGTYLAMQFWLAGFKYANASIAAILNQTSTVLVVLLAWLFLKEPIGKRGVIATLLGVAGSILVLV